LRGLRERLGYSQKEFADMLSIKQQSLSKYESGALNIPDRLKVELLQYGVRIEWLLTGEGEIFVTPPSIGERLKAVRLEYEHDIETMADFLTVTPEEYRRYENNEVDPPEEVLGRLEGNFNISAYWARSGRGEKDTLAPKGALRRENGHLVSFAEIGKDSFVVPMLDQSVAAGESSALSEADNITGYIRLPRRLRSYGSSLAALPVRGDSMYPTIDDGDLVVCDTGKWQGEGIYVIRLEDEALVKRLSKRPAGIMVISDNPQYPAFEVTGETPLDVVGRVRAVVRLVR